jgi:Kelch motif protein
VASVGNQVLIAGGRARNTTSASDQVDVYDASNGSWSSAQLSQPRWGMAVASVGTQVLFAGGSSGGAVSDVVDVYDSATGEWSTGALTAARGRRRL